MFNPVWMSQRIAARYEAAETVTEKNHLRNVHCLAPLLQKRDILLLNLQRLLGEIRP